MVSVPRRDPAVTALRSPHPIFPMIRIIKQDPDFIAIYTFAYFLFSLSWQQIDDILPAHPHLILTSAAV